jgi:hypothetical protein
MDSDLERQRTAKLLGDAVRTGKELLHQELDLARAELKANLRSEAAMAKGLGLAGVCALLAANLLLVAVAFALSLFMPGWLAALIVASVVLAVGTIAGLVGWRKRVRRPLALTQRTLQDDWQWAKERLA